MIDVESLAAGPGIGFTVRISLDKCWGDSENTKREIAAGRYVSTMPCLNPVDEGGIGLCPTCYSDIVG